MNRRGFLKSFAVLFASAAVGLPALVEAKAALPEQLGGFFAFSDTAWRRNKFDLIAYLVDTSAAEARKHCPRGARVSVHVAWPGKPNKSDPLGQRGYVEWRHPPDLRGEVVTI